MSKFNPKFIQEEQKSFNNNFVFSDLKSKELFKAKIHFQKNRMTREHSSRVDLKNKNTIIHSISTNQIYNGNNNLIPSSNISERKQINNFNINIRNLNFNNTFNDLSKNNENRSFSKNTKLNKVFSKIGNDFIIKNNINFSKPKINKENKLNNLKTKIYNNNNNNLSNIKITKRRNKFGIENVIENLMYLTKDKPLIFNLNKNPSNSSLDSISKINIKKDNNEKESQLIDNNDCIIETHFKIWECIFEMENHYENKKSLINLSKKFLNLISIEIEKKRKFEIFQLSNFNLVYQKIIKIYIILQIYIRFLLLDFNYEVKIKKNVKNMLFHINEYFILLVSNFVFIKENLKENQGCSKINLECINSYNFIIKNHRLKKIKEQPFIFASIMFKNLDIPISIIKQFSNNFFKLGYFTPIHSICIDLFQNIDITTIKEIFKIVNINVLYYITNNNLKNKTQNNKNNNNNNSIINKNILEDINTFDIFCELGIFNIQYPLLPPLENENNNIYTLVLDLDETLVHFFYTPSGGTFLIRPYCLEFLNKMSKLCEIVIFTAAMKDYADSILDILDSKKNIIKYRLYRQHTSIEGMSFSKDLSKLGRDLNKVIIIDNLSDNFKLQPNNGIHIGTWTDNMKDTELLEIGKFLEDLILRKPNDVRVIIQKIKEDFEKKNSKNVVCSFKGIDLNNFMT